MSNLQALIEQDLMQIADDYPILSEQLKYALFPGKRLRGCLLLTFLASFDFDISEPAVAAAAAVEITHSFSLVHDDMPALDNDEFRRGKPSFFMKYGEANALLIGDILQYLGQYRLRDEPDLMVLLIKYSGLDGMVFGQWLETNTSASNIQTLQQIQDYKTAKLFELVGRMASSLMGIKTDDLANIGMRLGRCLQWLDDLVDYPKDLEGTNVLNFKARDLIISEIKTNLADIKLQSDCWPNSKIFNSWLEFNFDSELRKIMYNV